MGNTMRMLSWELRPENPCRYTHDYMVQAQQFERDGWKQLLRWPGRWPKYGLRETNAATKYGKHDRQQQGSESGPDFSEAPMPAEHEGGANLCKYRSLLLSGSN